MTTSPCRPAPRTGSTGRAPGRDARPAGGGARRLHPPGGLGRAHALTESRVAARLRGLLPSYGVAAENVFAKGYWNA
ncbi:hypothetical protein ACIBCA_14615 [Kitasatospora sp. NPDC051170]|uniref:hypothetical protein n=1 Tax=Kitasatospora sp. NPDC051170 TaxID=3364056 RepID=UPI0037A2E3F0